MGESLVNLLVAFYSNSKTSSNEKTEWSFAALAFVFCQEKGPLSCILWVATRILNPIADVMVPRGILVLRETLHLKLVLQLVIRCGISVFLLAKI